MNNETIIVIDDHEGVRASLRALLESAGFQVKDYASATLYLGDSGSGGDCLLVDLRMPEMSGMELLQELNRRRATVPIIVVTGHGDIERAVAAMKAGAYDFIEKPFDDEALLASIRGALIESHRTHDSTADNKMASELIAILTGREREVLNHLVIGQSNKLIAHELGISPRTVEIHRARVQGKLKARNLADLVRLARTAGQLH